jgi:Pyruvate/2-oxoacid:ferredoxin oxidoreductase delta subunit
MSKKNRKFPIRYTIQILFFIFISFIAIRHLVIGGGPGGTPSIHAYCPLGGIASLYSNIVHGTFVWKIQYSSYVLLVAVLAIGLVFGRGFCGWICPFGSLQEWLRILGEKALKIKKTILPSSIDWKMRYLKYGIVLLIIIPTYITGRLVFENYDPFVAFFHFGKNITTHLKPAYIILGVVLVFSLFIGRFWCRYFCPLGAILALINKISLFKIKRDSKTCSDCGLCDKKCPVDIPLCNIDTIKSAECIGCLESEEACPQKGCLSAYAGRLRFSLASYGVLLIVSFFFFIGLARATNYWQTKGSSGNREYRVGGRRGSKATGAVRIPQYKEEEGISVAKEQEEAETQQEHEQEVKGEGTILREGVRLRGSMTLKEAARLAELDYDEFCQRLNIPTSTPGSLLLKDIMIKYDIDMGEITEKLRGKELSQIEKTQLMEEEKGQGTYFREGVWLRGSMTVEEVAEAAQLSYSEVCSRLKIPASTPKSTLLKEIMAEYNLDMGQLIEKLGGEKVPEKGRYEERSGAQRGRGRRAYGKGRVVLIGGVVLRGSMTLEEVAEAAGLTHEQLCRALRIPASMPKESILKEVMIEYNYTMSMIGEMLKGK